MYWEIIIILEMVSKMIFTLEMQWKIIFHYRNALANSFY